MQARVCFDFLHDDADYLCEFEREYVRGGVQTVSSRLFVHGGVVGACGGVEVEENTVTLDSEMKDARGLPVGRITYEWGENDIKLAGAARDKAIEMMKASGACKVIVGLNYGAHAMGTCRMGNDARTSVVNEYCQSHDIENLFICDTSVFVTGSGVNPTLTAMAIAQRSAEFIVGQYR